MRHYKKKRHTINDCRDTEKANDLRKTLNVTERQYGKKEAAEGLANQEDDKWYYQNEYETTSDAITDYNRSMANGLKWMFKKVAPEVCWADTDDSWNYSYGYPHHTPRAMSALTYYWDEWEPETSWGRDKLILKIFSER